MKKVILVIAITGICLFASAQEKSQSAIGLRFGLGTDYIGEISYQQALNTNRMELDLGWGGGRYWKGWTVTGLHQWVMPIESGFYWYLGAGPALGYWTEKRSFYENEGGLYLAASANVGAEYRFAEIPLQLAIDYRPEFGLINRWKAYGGGFGIAVRYCF